MLDMGMAFRFGGIPRQRYIRSYIRLFLLFVVIFMFFLIYGQMSLEKNKNISMFKNLVIISATYYEYSNIYPKNSIVLLVNAPSKMPQNDPFLLPPVLLARTESPTNSSSAYFAFGPAAPLIVECRWTSYLAVIESVPEPSRLKLYDSYLSLSGVEIPLRRPYSGRHVYVGSCLSPIFHMEHWQLLLLSIEMNRYFGAKLMVVYLQSALAEIYEVLKIYSSIVEVEPWYSIKMSELDMQQTVGYDPNFELDWRNQATAHTDCLIKYRNAANFLIIGDLDDILVPHVGQSYEEELGIFNKRYITAAMFSYIRFDTHVSTEADPVDFKFHGTLGSTRVELYQPDDPKYVANTARVESCWIHSPGIIKVNTTHKPIPSKMGHMLHLRSWHFTGSNRSHQLREKSVWDPIPLFGNGKILDSAVLDRINRTFWTTWAPHKALLHSLPSRQHYAKEFVRCYDKIFYKLDKHVDNCPGPNRCKIEAIPGLRCVNGRRNFSVNRLGSHINLIISNEEGHLELSQNGCTL